MKKKVILIILFLVGFKTLNAQEFLKLNTETALRYEAEHYNKTEIHTNIKPYIIKSNNNEDSSLYIHTNNLIFNNLLNSDIQQYNKNNLYFRLNPIIELMPAFEIKSKELLNNYKFGISANLKIGKNLHINFDGFYGVASFDKYTQAFVDSTKIIPHFGKYISKKNKSNYDYYNINAYISYNINDYFNLSGGIGKNFWGEGYRSLFLSDNAGSYPFVRASLDIWKFKYIWMFAALKDPNTEDATKELKNKLLFSHYLSWNATKWLNLNFFEAIVSNPVDSVGITYFNINYLNPAIFLRPTEFSGGSADNALLGFGAKIKILEKYQLYSQFIVDEFVFSEIKANKNWWGNKYGIQTGIKIYNLLNISNLFARLEYNKIRPYTFSYSNSIMCYGHFYQPLAHPLGGNLEEYIFQLHYFKNRYSFDILANFSESGMDTNNVSYGQNIYKPYTFRPDDYGNTFKQGYLAKFSNINFTASYIINPKMNLTVNFNVSYRKQQVYSETISGYFISLGIKSLLY